MKARAGTDLTSALLAFMPNNGQELVVDIEGCETNSVDEYCVVHRGQLVVGIVTFVPFVSSTNLICKINGVFDGDLVFPFPGRCPDPCQHLDSGPNGEYQVCPLVYDITDPKPIKYEIEMEILPEYPLVSVSACPES